MAIENLDDAIKYFRSKGDFVHIVYFGGRKFIQLSNSKHPQSNPRPNVKGPSWKWSRFCAKDGIYWGNYTPTSFVSYAKCVTSGQPWNKNVKYFRHRNNRAKTKSLIDSENYDALDPKSLAKDENIWNWD
jgi:hypothetical protein